MDRNGAVNFFTHLEKGGRRAAAGGSAPAETLVVDAAMPRRPDAPAVLYDKDGVVAILSLNRPHVLNAYNVGMRDALFEALQAATDDPEVRAVVLRGNGPAFCTGGDVTEFG